MTNKISHFIASQLSEKIQTENPLFVGFLKLYYEYTEIRTNAIGLIQNRHLDADIDNTLDAYIDEFYAVYGKYLPKETALDRRALIKLLNTVYKHKGTEKTFSFLFKALYNKDSTYRYPKDQILKTSDGIWQQESFIVVEKISGDFAELSSNVIQSFGVSSAFEFYITKYEQLNSTTAKLYFNNNSVAGFYIDTTIQIIDGSTIKFLGKVKPSIEKITIKSPGKKFKVGQIFTIPGSISPTIVRVSRTAEFGAIEHIEIISYGYTHAVSNYTLTSYFKIPDNSELLVTNIEYNELVDLDAIPPNVNMASPSNSILEYRDDLAEIEITYNVVSKVQGTYFNSAGHLSDSFIKLEDNYYYQLFSYVVEADLNLNIYRESILKLLHPAGLKYFSSIYKSNELDLSEYDLDSQRIFKLYFKEKISNSPLSEQITKRIEKNVWETFGNVATYSAEDYFAEDYNTSASLVDVFAISVLASWGADTVVWNGDPVLFSGVTLNN